MFNKEFWNVQHAVTNGLPETNNHVEGFNNRLKHAIGCSHPSVSMLIDILKQEYNLVKFDKIQHDMGGPQPKIRKVKSKEDKARELIDNYGNYSNIYYLGLVAASISL